MRVSAGVPGLEPRLTEPESVVLPITPYPRRHANRAVLEPRRTATTLAEGPGPLQTGPQPCQRALPAEQLHRLVQRRRHRPPGDGHPHGRERLARLEPQPVDQRLLQRALDLRRRPRRARPGWSAPLRGPERRPRRGSPAASGSGANARRRRTGSRSMARRRTARCCAPARAARRRRAAAAARGRRAVITPPAADEVRLEAPREVVGRQRPQMCGVDGLGLLECRIARCSPTPSRRRTRRPSRRG